MVQSTIDFWIDQSKGTAQDIPYYFYLEWNSRFYPKEQAKFITQAEYERIVDSSGNNIFRHAIVNKFIHRPITLVGKISGHSIFDRENYKYENDPNYSNIHFLKSHLQKCIRRKKTEKAIQTAKHLIQIDPIAFLRRLTIIFVEDVSPTHFYTTLIWLMIAVSSKKFSLSTNHKEWLLGVVYIACEAPYRERFPNKNTKNKSNALFDNLIDLYKEERINQDIMSLIMSFFMRVSFGGMNCDMNMLRVHSSTWMQRGRNDNEDQKWKDYFYRPVRTISWLVTPLEKHEWEYSAIDFHCFPKMIDWLLDQYPDLERDQIREIIWKNRSCLNTRGYYGEDNKEKSIFEKNRCGDLISDEEWKEFQKSLNRISFYAIKTSSV